MIFSPFIAPFFLLPVIIIGTIVGAILMGFAVIGGPGPCEPGDGPIVISEQNADAFQQKWDQFDATLDGGSPASVTFSESEVSSRTIRAMEGDLDDEDWVEGFRVCLHDGYGELSGTVDLPGFLDIKFKARGTAYIGETLNVNIHSVELGSIPGFIDNWVRAMVDDTAETLDEYDFGGHSYTLTIRDGEVQVDGTP